jgi:hypothetical protein
MSTPPSDPLPFDRLFTIPDAADWLALKPRTLRQSIAHGEVAIARPSKRSIRVPESELRRLMVARIEARARKPRTRRHATPVGPPD